MRIIGITGGSGAGKSTFSGYLAEQLPDSLLICADSFMHEESKRLEQEILRKIGRKKNEMVFSYNYYLESFHNMTNWVEVIAPSVIGDIEERILQQGQEKDYIIVDWVFLPLCDFISKCDLTICIKTDYDIRLERLSRRLRDKRIYNEGDRSYSSYQNGIIEKRLIYTDLDELGYPSQYQLTNNESLQELQQKAEHWIDKLLSV